MIILEDGKNYKLTIKAIFSDKFYETILHFRSDVGGFVDDKFGALYRLDNKRILKIEEVELLGKSLLFCQNKKDIH